MSYKIALVMMVKNEQCYALKTLESVKKFISTFVIQDTGSTDNTISEIEQWCKENKKKLHVQLRDFVNFEVTRNELLAFADKVAREDWFLLMDANDEWRGDPTPLYKYMDRDAIYLEQAWKFERETIKYQNCRLIHARRGWRYIGVVHEYIEKENSSVYYAHDLPDADKLPTIFQDRTNDGGKSAKRFERDYELLLEEHKRDPNNARATFYLARTCDALGRREEAVQYFEERSKQGGFMEEVFLSHMSRGTILKGLGRRADALESFLEAYEVDRRVEPLLELATCYIEKRAWHTAYMYLSYACELTAPTGRLLFVDPRKYTYQRWHMMGIVAYYIDELQVGSKACQRAINESASAKERKLNQDNMAFYLKKLFPKEKV